MLTTTLAVHDKISGKYENQLFLLKSKLVCGVYHNTLYIPLIYSKCVSIPKVKKKSTS